ncbi:MAG: hypothetical protein WC759_01775, partial [Candidatus Micrarchaeia archaeon]
MGTRRGQVLALEAVLALFIAILFVYLLLGTGVKSTWDMRLERAGYDTVNAIYADREMYDALVAGAERNGYSASETSTINARLARYVALLSIARIELYVDGTATFAGQSGNLPNPPLNKESFYALLPLR